MAQRKILTYGNPTLKRTAARVADVDGSIRAIVTDLFDSMYAARGVGLAAPQIDELLAVIGVLTIASVCRWTVSAKSEHQVPLGLSLLVFNATILTVVTVSLLVKPIL